MKIENTFGIEAQARIVISYDSEQSLCEAISVIHDKYADLPLLHIGCGSNLLFLNDFDGIVLKSNIKGICLKEETADDVLVEVGSGEICDEFIDYAISHGWFGMENLSLIPGQIGAAAVQNIGAYGMEVCDVIEVVRGISLTDGTCHLWKRDECRYGYRRSIFKEELWGKYAITRVTFRLSKHFEPKLQYGGLAKAVNDSPTPTSLTASQLRNIIIDIRQAKLPDPSVQGNAGSFFKNPIVSAEKAHQLLANYPNMPRGATYKGSAKQSRKMLPTSSA